MCKSKLSVLNTAFFAQHGGRRCETSTHVCSKSDCPFHRYFQAICFNEFCKMNTSKYRLTHAVNRARHLVSLPFTVRNITLPIFNVCLRYCCCREESIVVNFATSFSALLLAETTWWDWSKGVEGKAYATHVAIATILTAEQNAVTTLP